MTDITDDVEDLLRAIPLGLIPTRLERLTCAALRSHDPRSCVEIAQAIELQLIGAENVARADFPTAAKQAAKQWPPAIVDTPPSRYGLPTPDIARDVFTQIHSEWLVASTEDVPLGDYFANALMEKMPQMFDWTDKRRS